MTPTSVPIILTKRFNTVLSMRDRTARFAQIFRVNLAQATQQYFQGYLPVLVFIFDRFPRSCSPSSITFVSLYVRFVRAPSNFSTDADCPSGLHIHVQLSYYCAWINFYSKLFPKIIFPRVLNRMKKVIWSWNNSIANLNTILIFEIKFTTLFHREINILD